MTSGVLQMSTVIFHNIVHDLMHLMLSIYLYYLVKFDTPPIYVYGIEFEMRCASSQCNYNMKLFYIYS